MKYSIGDYLLCVKRRGGFSCNVNDVVTVDKITSILDVPVYKVKIISSNEYSVTGHTVVDSYVFVFEPEEDAFIKISKDEFNIKDILE